MPGLADPLARNGVCDNTGISRAVWGWWLYPDQPVFHRIMGMVLMPGLAGLSWRNGGGGNAWISRYFTAYKGVVLLVVWVGVFVDAG